MSLLRKSSLAAMTWLSPGLPRHPGAMLTLAGAQRVAQPFFNPISGFGP